MTSSLDIATEVHYHVRSISLPSRLYPSLHKIEKELKRLKTLATSSLQTHEAIKASLIGLSELYNSVQELIGCPLTQQALSRQYHHHHVEKPLDMSVSLLDVCGSTREMMVLMKEHVLELQSAFRRKGLEYSSINSHIGAYICFRKKARKDMSKKLKALKKLEEGSFKSYPLLDVDYHLLMVINVLRELSNITILVFRNVLLLFMCGTVLLKKTNRRWSLFSRCDGEKRMIMNEMEDIDVALWSFYRKSGANKGDLEIVKRRLGELDESIRELETGLDCLFRCLIQQRVSLLNLLTP